MDNDTTSAAPAEKTPSQLRREGVVAWHDADTEDKKKAVVAKYPFLADTFSEAQNYK